MVYINQCSGTITIPKHTKTTGLDLYKMVISSHLTDDITLFDNGYNISTNGLYYKFPLGDLNNLNVGEYTYKLYDNENHVLETGLLTFGNFKVKITHKGEYLENKIQYNG